MRLNFCDYRFPSGQTRLSVDEVLRPKPLFTGREDIFAVYQIHFGSRCATESVYWYLPAKVELKKSHFGKQSFIECTLRRPPCQSELAEACETTSKTKAPVAATSLRAKTQKPNVSENKMSFAESEEACWRAKTKSSTRSRKTPFGSGCRRDASRWGGG